MLSNKLTFSLTSLVILLMVSFCFPVAAQKAETIPLVAVGSTSPVVIPAGEFYVFAMSENAGLVGFTDQLVLGVDFWAFDEESRPQAFERFFMAGGTVQLVLTGTDTNAVAGTDNVRAPWRKISSLAKSCGDLMLIALRSSGSKSIIPLIWLLPS